MTSTPVYRILIIDDTPSIHDDFRKVLTPPRELKPPLRDLASAVFGDATPVAALPTFTLDFALQGPEGLALLQDAVNAQQPYAVAFVDMRMPPGWDGLETIRHLWATDPDLQVVICTAYSDHTWSTITERLGPTDNLLILKKPFDHIEALQLAHTLARKWEITRTNRAHLSALDHTVALRTQELQAAQLRFAEAFNASPLPEVIIALDPFEVLEINDAFRQQFGFEIERLRHITPENFGRGLDPVKWRELLDRISRKETIDEYPFSFRPDPRTEHHLRCSVRAIDVNGRACSIWVLRDVTKQLETEQQLRQSQKMEAVGQLAAGVAHDFNNLLTVIHGYTAEVLATRHDAELQRLLGPVQTAAAQAAALTRQLLIFSRRDVPRPELINLPTILTGLQPLLRRLIGSDIDIEWRIAPALPPVIADPATIEQVIVNLVVNARDAMPEGGRIAIDVQARQIDAATAAQHLEAKPGDYIAITVTDTGSGIDPQILPRIFEPFFTTKEAGKGTGLGLSTVYSIVKQNGGWIRVHSQLKVGTVFTLYHPVAPTSQRAPSPSQRPFATSETPPNSLQRVLVAEDDPIVQALLCSILKRRGLTYDLAPDGVSALRLWQERGCTHDLIVTDIVMPNGINGIRLAQEIRKNTPTVPIVLMTGYSAALNGPNKPDIPGYPTKILLKPFLPTDLLGAINEAIELCQPDGSQAPFLNPWNPGQKPPPRG